MSRSYRKPYAAITGVYTNSGDDKRVARRCWRRAQEQALRNCKDWEELVMPKRLEASFNDTWSWGRDGGKFRIEPPDPYRINFEAASKFDLWWFEYRTRYYKECCRK